LLIVDSFVSSDLHGSQCDALANASHELRSSLTVVSDYLETLSQDPALDKDLHGPVAEMRRQAERMTGIVRDLLELSALAATASRSCHKPSRKPTGNPPLFAQQDVWR
jgi:two-component system phosphate regulon sensor histidine kinase PhoR